MVHPHPGQAELLTRLHHLLEHLAHVLPGQAPIRDFVHHNTLHGFQHLPFPDALKAAHDVTGTAGYWPPEKFRELYQQGRINRADLDAVLRDDATLRADEVLLVAGSQVVTRADVYLIALTYPLTPVTYNQFVWQVEENHALAAFQADVPVQARDTLLALAAQPGSGSTTVGVSDVISDLWEACMQVLDLEYYLLHPEELMSFTPERAARLFADQLVGAAPAVDDDIRQPARELLAALKPYPAKQAILHDVLKNLLEVDVLEPVTPVTEQHVRLHSRQLLDTLFQQVGKQLTIHGLLKALLGSDIMDEVRPLLLRSLAAWLDQGLASWHTATPQQGFYASWKQSARLDMGGFLSGLVDWQGHLDSLPDDAVATIEAELRRMGIPEADWMDYLERLALELPGWSGMFLWRHQHPGYEGLPQRVDMFDYLAVRLVLEHAFARHLCHEHWMLEASLPNIRGRFRRHTAEFMVRYYTFGRTLPEYLLTLARQMIARSRPGIYEDDDWLQLAHMIWTWWHSPLMNPEHGTQPYDHGWRLFRLAQHLGLDGAAVRALPAETFPQIFACLDVLDAERVGYLWLQAYEHHYHGQLFAAVRSNHQRGTWADRTGLQRPLAQVVFCMDEREEGVRRHLEALNPAIETLGAAAFFNIPMNWRALDDERAWKLCPVPVTPVHEVRELAVDGVVALKAEHDRRRGQRLGVQEALHQWTRQHLLGGTLASLLAAPAALVLLLGKAFAPKRVGSRLQAWARGFDLTVPSRVYFTAAQVDAGRSASQNQQGFTDQEQADLVGKFLVTHGLTHGFGQLVVMMGHYSSNQNNPHQAAYGCGACSGRYSGPNARTFAAMANRPAVRALLVRMGLQLLDDCWFVGAEHDTCSEEIRWTDLDLIPTQLQAAYQRLQSELELACQHSAHERCRKLASAPRHPDLSQALHHVAERAFDYSQARPELGHATNAAAFIGRRHLSQGAFFDRRVFLISYDYRLDPDGKILESILLNAGPVGAGISLEYYFSSISNERYGSGSKITHNITSLLGVMEGTSSDLRTGLPQQMVEIHEPMRLQILLEASTTTVAAIYARQPVLQELIGHGWVLVSVKDPETAEIYQFKPDKGFSRWVPGAYEPPVVACSADWYGGQSQHLPPALLAHRPVSSGGAAHV